MIYNNNNDNNDNDYIYIYSVKLRFLTHFSALSLRHLAYLGPWEVSPHASSHNSSRVVGRDRDSNTASLSLGPCRSGNDLTGRGTPRTDWTYSHNSWICFGALGGGCVVEERLIWAQWLGNWWCHQVRILGAASKEWAPHVGLMKPLFSVEGCLLWDKKWKP